MIQTIDATEPKGEFTIIIDGAKNESRNNFKTYQELKMDLDKLIKIGLKRSSAASYLASKYGITKNIIYNLR